MAALAVAAVGTLVLLAGPAPSAPARRSPAALALTLPKAIGQLIIGTYRGPRPPASMLAAVRAGRVGAIILMGDDTAGGVAATRAAVGELQAAARGGANPGLLIMTDQEGGEVKRLPGPPSLPASGMSSPSVAGAQGAATGRLLRAAGVNVDLAPVADVARIDGFMEQEHRTFGTRPRVVAQAACAFAAGLAREHVAYTLKHFPGLGDAIDSTDDVPVRISEPAAEIQADGAAYRQCGRGPLALVMVSSASYSHLTGSVPAVLSPAIYRRVMPADHIAALTIGDSFESGAIDAARAPARTALNAGLDMVMYPGVQAAAAGAYRGLLRDVRDGALSLARVQSADAAVLALKRALGLVR